NAGFNVFDLATGKEAASFTLGGKGEEVSRGVLSPDGRRFAVSGKDHSVHIWDLATRKDALLLTGHTDAVFSMTFSPDGKYLSTAANDQSLRLWDLSDGLEVRRLSTPRVDYNSATAFSPDGTFLAVATATSDVRVLDLHAAQTKQTVR